MKNNIYIDRKEGKGKSIFANKDFKKDEVIFLICGPIISEATIYSIPLNLNLFIDPAFLNNPAMYLCHDCEPSAGIKNTTLLVACRDIKKGEEIAIDYAMVVYEYGKEMTEENLVCNCNKSSCRKKLGSYKNLSEELREKYQNYLSDYLKKM
jgi:hypothetical protein